MYWAHVFMMFISLQRTVIASISSLFRVGRRCVCVYFIQIFWFLLFRVFDMKRIGTTIPLMPLWDQIQQVFVRRKNRCKRTVKHYVPALVQREPQTFCVGQVRDINLQIVFFDEIVNGRCGDQSTHSLPFTIQILFIWRCFRLIILCQIRTKQPNFVLDQWIETKLNRLK